MNWETIRDFIVAVALVLCFALAIVSLNSCVPCPGPNDKVNKIERETIYFDEGGYISEMDLYKFEYKGHEYIRFGSYDYQTIVHDPDCKCHKGNNTNNTLFDW